VLDQAEAKILHIAEQGERGARQYEEIGKLLGEVVERIETLYNRDDPSAVTGVPTGFADLDEKTSGLQPGDLVIIAGRRRWARRRSRSTSPSTSRSTPRSSVAVFSMEMGASQLALRMIGSVGRLDQHKLRTGARGRGLGEDSRRRSGAVRRADPDRRDSGAQCDRGPLAGAPHREDLRQARASSSSTTCS
jgi:replicative DNA helicase